MNGTLSRPSAFAKPTADKSGTLSPVAGGEGRGEGAIRGSWREGYNLFPSPRSSLLGKGDIVRRSLNPEGDGAMST